MSGASVMLQSKSLSKHHYRHFYHVFYLKVGSDHCIDWHRQARLCAWGAYWVLSRGGLNLREDYNTNNRIALLSTDFRLTTKVTD